MAKTIKFEMSAKDVKTIAAAAEILQRIVTPAEEPVVAVIEEAPAKAKKAAAKKNATAKKAPTKKEAKKPTKKTKLITKNVGSHCRVALPRKYLEATGARFGQMDVLKKYVSDDAVYFIPNGADFNRKNYKKVKTINYNPNGQVNVGNLLKVKTGDEVRVDLRGDKIIVRK